MDLFRNAAKDKYGKNPQLKKDAKHELSELGGEKKAEAFEKKVKMAKKMTSHEAIREWKRAGKKPKGLHKVEFPSEFHKRDTSTDFL